MLKIHAKKYTNLIMIKLVKLKEITMIKITQIYVFSCSKTIIGTQLFRERLSE